MKKYQIECFVCGNTFELPEGKSMPKTCPRCHGTFLESKTIQLKRPEKPRQLGDVKEDIRLARFKDFNV